MCECRERYEWEEDRSGSADAFVFHYFVRCLFVRLNSHLLHLSTLTSHPTINKLAAHPPTSASQPPRALVSSRRIRVCRPFSVASTSPSTVSCALRRSALHSKPPVRARPSSLLLLLPLRPLPMLLVAVLLLLLLVPLLLPYPPPLPRPHLRRCPHHQRLAWRTRRTAALCDSARRVRCAPHWTRVRTTRSCCNRLPHGMGDTLASVYVSESVSLYLSLCVSLIVALCRSLFLSICVCVSLIRSISIHTYLAVIVICILFFDDIFSYQDF
jgi:hypothetical protein